MKNLCLGLIASTTLAACTNALSPTPNKLAQDIQAIPPQTVLSIRSQNNLTPPKGAQSIVKLSTFVADDNLYDSQGNHLIIPRGALIVGLYSNDGMRCTLEWKAMYLSQKELDAGHGTLALNQVTKQSSCDPVTGIKSGDRIIVSFSQNFDHYDLSH